MLHFRIFCAALAVLLSFSACSGTSSTEFQEAPAPAAGPSVIVVGAGMAGLRAASLLNDAGMQVTVLESRDRIGGRTWSDDSLGTTLDLGGSWIHGITGNPLYEYAAEVGAEMVEWNYDLYTVFNPDGSTSRLINEDDDRFFAPLEAAGAAYVVANGEGSLQDAIDGAVANGSLSEFTNEEINFIATTFIEDSYATEASNIGLIGYSESGGESFPGADAVDFDPEVVFPRGYNQITDALAEGLSIENGVRVNSIDYSGEQVIVSDGQNSYSADYVLVTVPLGVLKEGVIEFQPALPTSKLAAINAMDMGVLDKVYLRFPDVFWRDEFDNFGYVSDSVNEYASWLSLVNLTGEPILLAFSSADEAIANEALSDAEIIAKVMQILRSIYGESIPEPTGSTITRWYQDPNSYGSYSNLPPGSSVSAISDLAQEIDNKLFFAGEATSEYQSTVHGAYLSGVREAEKIIAVQNSGS
ncbi:MAG: FAD-dependent oxidoreductase [Pseudomonadota bacterium]